MGLLTLTVWPLGSVFLGAFLVADPLFAINSVVNGVWRWELGIAAVMLVAPLLLGRAFCGYLCPMGVLVELAGPRDDRRAGRWLRSMPVMVLVMSGGLLVFGSAAYLVFDPLSTLTRTSTVALYPMLDRIIRLVGDVAYLAAPARPAVDAATTVLAGRLLFSRPLTYQLAFGTLAFFVTVLALSYRERRMWCRHICPLGALLGQVGRFAIAGRVVDGDLCTGCGRCAAVCPMAAIDARGAGAVDAQEGVQTGRSIQATTDARPEATTDPTRCQLGFECADACPEAAIRFGLGPSKRAYDPSRRAVLVTGGLSLAGGFFLFTSWGRRHPGEELIRPPGARSEADFLGLCSRCGQCMKVCPTNVIQPAVFAAGLEGMLTPQMAYRHGYCDWTCNECGKVCPTGAIDRLSLPVKRKAIVGRAYIDRDRCIPWADFKDCIVCEELCPIPDKAVVLFEETVLDPEGRLVTLKRPSVVVERCTGCGVCEFKCPVPRRAAIEVRGAH